MRCFSGEGWNVWAAVRSAPVLGTAPEAAEVRAVDLISPEEVAALVRAARPSVVVHLAAQSSVLRSARSPVDTIAQNVLMQRNLLSAVRAHAPESRIVVVGSSEEYSSPDASELPISETHPLGPSSAYGHSKLLQDLSSWQWGKQYGLDVVRVRPFQTLGPRRGSGFVAGALARQIAEMAAGQRDARIVVGNRHVRRDFTDVRDVARALYLAALHGDSGAVYNIASGEAHAIEELIEIMLAEANVDAVVRTDPQRVRPGEPPVIVGDASRLGVVTGWMPRVSFSRSVRDTLRSWMHGPYPDTAG